MLLLRRMLVYRIKDNYKNDRQIKDYCLRIGEWPRADHQCR